MARDIEVEVEQLSWEELQQGNPRVWDPAFGKTVSSALIPLIRTYFNAAKAEPVHFPLDTAGVGVIDHDERHADHFLEVQHVLQAVLSQPGFDAHRICNLPVGAFLRLSRFLNHTYNLYSIPAAWNLYKSKIGFELYNPTAHTTTDKQAEQQQFMRNYMALEVDGDEIAKVEDRVFILLRNMEHAEGEYSELCNLAGAVIGSFLQTVSPTLRDKVNAGAFNEH